MATERFEQTEVKEPYHVQLQDTSLDGGSPTDVAVAQEMAWGEKAQDMADMKRLGKKQEFKVLMSFSSTAPLIN
jgi:hypothetical protein